MRLNTVEFLLSEGWEAAVRNGLVTLAAISNTAVALLILGGLVLVGINVEHMAALQAQAAVITVELADDAERGEVEKALWASPLVSDVKFVSKEENSTTIIPAKNNVSTGYWPLKPIRGIKT